MRLPPLIWAAFLVAPSAAAQAPDTEIWLAPLSRAGGGLTVDEPVNVTNRPGYDNQPWFLPDGRAFLFVAQHDGQTDVFRYDLRRRTAARLTSTPESEYSPMLTPDGTAITVVRVEADSSQHLWLFSRAGAAIRRAPGDVVAVGYYGRTDDRSYVMFLADSVQSLVISDLRRGRVTRVGRRLAGSAPQRIPRSRDVSVVRIDSGRGRWIERLDLKSGRLTPIVATRGDSPHYAWTKRGTILMAEGSAIFEFDPRRDASWRQIAAFTAPGLQRISRLALSPAQDRLAIVSEAPKD